MAAPGLRREGSPVGNDRPDDEGFDTTSELSAGNDHSPNDLRDDLFSSDPLAEGLDEP